MRKFLFPLRLLLGFISLLCLVLSYQGLDYLNPFWYVVLLSFFIVELVLTFYDIVMKKEYILDDEVYQGLGIGLFLYITLLYIRLFFDYGILYDTGNLLQRFGLIDTHLIVLCIGMFFYIIYHICIEKEKIPPKKKKNKKK